MLRHVETTSCRQGPIAIQHPHIESLHTAEPFCMQTPAAEKKLEMQTNQTHSWCSLLTACSMQIKMKAWNAQNESPERLKQNQTKAL